MMRRRSRASIGRLVVVWSFVVASSRCWCVVRQVASPSASVCSASRRCRGARIVWGAGQLVVVVVEMRMRGGGRKSR